MSDSSSIDNLHAAIKTLRGLRHSFSNLFLTLTEGSRNESDEENEVTIQKLFRAMTTNLKDLERNISSLSPTPMTPPVHSSIDLLFLDPSPDKLLLYHQLLDCYTWMDKVYYYSKMMHSNINGNQLKRTIVPSKRKRPMQPNNANPPPGAVDAHIQTIKSLFPEMSLYVGRPLGTNAILQVTLGRVLKGIVTFRGLLIESVIIRSYNEPHTDDEGKVDLYRSSQYKVFQKVTDNANAAMLHFFSLGFVELSIRSFFAWLYSFSTLFTDVCKKCGKHLHNNFPPTWREFTTLQSYHEHCRP